VFYAPEQCVFYTTEKIEVLEATGSPNFGTNDRRDCSYLAVSIKIDDRINNISLALTSGSPLKPHR